MKKVFLVFMSLMFIMCLVGCGEKEEKINIDFIIDGKSHLVEIDKGTSISNDMIPLSNEEEVIGLYYDENMMNKYVNELVEQNIKLYVKLKECSNMINNGKKIEYKINYNGIGSIGYKIVDGIFQVYSCGIINSLVELNNLCKEYNNSNFMNEHESIYNEEFFIDKSLIIYSFETGHGKETIIEDLILNEEELIIVEKTILKDGFYTTEAFRWTILIEVKKIEIENAKEIKIKHK